MAPKNAVPPRGSLGQRKKNKLSYLKVVLAMLLGIFCTAFYQGSERLIKQYSKNVQTPKYAGVCLGKLIIYNTFHFQRKFYLDNWNPNGNLRTIDRVFHRLGYEAVDAMKGDEWDVLWTIEYPFEEEGDKMLFKVATRPLKPHQRIGHFPGIFFLTDKGFLSSRLRDTKSILPGFNFPNEIEVFKDFVAKNPNARFVEKSTLNRGIRLVQKNEIKYELDEIFYQFFMERPFLVDGHAMDFAVYVVITSIDPLRVYRYDYDVHLRFCQDPYYPLNPKNLNSYVVSDTRRIVSEMPSLKDYFQIHGFSCRQAIEEYITSKGHNVSQLWEKIDSAIVRVILSSEKEMKNEVSWDTFVNRLLI